jgi:tetratricopeptide (TPR) repeat protein
MILGWLNGREAAQIGAALADDFAPRTESAVAGGSAARDTSAAMQRMLGRADSEVRPLQLNFYKKAKFANAFKWRLIENGVVKDLADRVTQTLVLYLSTNQPSVISENAANGPSNVQSYSNNPKSLFAEGNRCFSQGAYDEAIEFYQTLVEVSPRHADGLNNLGAALSKQGRYAEAHARFRQAVKINPNYPEAHGNLGRLLRLRGQVAEAEAWLRRAIELKPTYAEARTNLGLCLITSGRIREAEGQFRKVLKHSPRDAAALFGLGHVAEIEGRFDEAETMFKRALESDRTMTSAWAALVGIRKQTTADAAWLKGAEEVAGSGIAPLDEAEVRFAIGKYHDDIGEYERAFGNYKRGNELLKSIADKYDRAARAKEVENLIRAYSLDSLSRPRSRASESSKPILVVGMPRSGTSLVEQILASHPSVKGAGELTFWSSTQISPESLIADPRVLDDVTAKKLAADYLRILEAQVGNAQHIVDKAPANSDNLGLIHSVFPKARIIYMQRDPIDTCLSIYFQRLAVSLNFTMDLSDLAHYFSEHQRLIAHWRSVLPRGTILDVPYAELVADQEGWTRKILDFVGLEWDDRCLNFHATKRSVATSSAWQVRQKIYGDSVERWRNYKRFIGPVLSLRDLKP